MEIGLGQGTTITTRRSWPTPALEQALAWPHLGDGTRLAGPSMRRLHRSPTQTCQAVLRAVAGCRAAGWMAPGPGDPACTWRHWPAGHHQAETTQP